MTENILKLLLELQNFRRKWKTNFDKWGCFKCHKGINIYDFPLIINRKYYCEKCGDEMIEIIKPMLAEERLKELEKPKLLPKDPYKYTLPRIFPDGIMACGDCPKKEIKDIKEFDDCPRLKMRRLFKEQNQEEKVYGVG
jgi:hypothetical protein